MNSLPSNNNTFIHSGTVSRISGNSVFVSLDSNVHCDGCRIKAACGISDSKNKEVEMECSDKAFSLDEHVQVVGQPLPGPLEEIVIVASASE